MGKIGHSIVCYLARPILTVNKPSAWFNVFLCLCFISLLSHNLAIAQAVDTSAEQEAKNIYSSVMSPFCPGRLLSDCPSSAATDLKEGILAQLVSGESRDSVIAELYSDYGDQMRAVPRAEGFGLFGWLVPICFLFGGLFLVLRWLRQQMPPQDGSIEN